MREPLEWLQSVPHRCITACVSVKPNGSGSPVLP